MEKKREITMFKSTEVWRIVGLARLPSLELDSAIYLGRFQFVDLGIQSTS